MKIEGYKKDWTTFDKLESGTVFDYDGYLYMKVTGVCAPNYNAVEVDSGRLIKFDNSDGVFAVDGTFVVNKSSI